MRRVRVLNKTRKTKKNKMNKMLKKILLSFREILLMNSQPRFRMKKTLFSNKSKKWNQKKLLVMKKRFKMKNYRAISKITTVSMRKIASLMTMILNLITARKRESCERSQTLKRKRNSKSNEKNERTWK